MYRVVSGCSYLFFSSFPYNLNCYIYAESPFLHRFFPYTSASEVICFIELYV